MNTRAALRLAPAEKLSTHREFVDYLEGKRVYPINVECSPSGVCQASCHGCFFKRGDLGGHRKVFIDTKRTLDLLRECSELGVKSISWSGGGEPSLHPDIREIVQRAFAEGLEQGIFTNALAMPKYNPAYMSWIRITMTDQPYKADCIKALRATKTLGFAFNYRGKEDDDYLRDTLSLAEEVGADYVQCRPMLPFHGATIDIDPPAFDHPLLHVTEYKFREARHKHWYKTCEAWHLASPFIWETGEVHVCSYVRNIVETEKGYSLGSIYEKTFKEIMDQAPRSVPVRHDCQTCCKNHENNQAIHKAKSLQDRNFP